MPGRRRFLVGLALGLAAGAVLVAVFVKQTTGYWRCSLERSGEVVCGTGDAQWTVEVVNVLMPYASWGVILWLGAWLLSRSASRNA